MNILKQALIILLILAVLAGGLLYWYTTTKNEGTAILRKQGGTKTIIVVSPGGVAYGELFRGFEEALRVTYPESAGTVKIIVKNAEGSSEKLKQYITEAVAQNPAMIVTASSPPTVQALEETKQSQIPIISMLGDPTKHGYIPSLQSSETNLAGIAQQAIELTPKRFEIMKRLFPKVSRVAVFYDTTCGPTKEARPVANALAPKIGLTITEFPLTSPTRDQVTNALKVVNSKDYDAVIFYPHGTLFSKSDLFIAKAKEAKIPIIMPDETSLTSGAVASYGPDFYLTGKQLTRIAEKVLNGTDPRDIPFEQAEDVKFVVSLQNLKTIGLNAQTDIATSTPGLQVIQ